MLHQILKHLRAFELTFGQILKMFNNQYPILNVQPGMRQNEK